MTDAFDWGALPEGETQKRAPSAKRTVVENIPAALQALVQKLWDNQERHWQELPDKEVAALYLTYVRAAGDHTTKTEDGKTVPHPTTVLASLATKGPDGKELSKTKQAKTVTLIVTERRGQKAKDDSAETPEEAPAETQAEGSETE